MAILEFKTFATENMKVEICPQRGGLISSIKLGVQEILYQDMYGETLNDFSKSVKGGIPLMFPNAGPLSEKQQLLGFDLPQHGIGRLFPWELVQNNEDGIIQRLSSNKKTKEAFPFDFELVNTIFSQGEYCILTHTIKNFSEKSMPVSSGLHPYFDIPNGEKDQVQFNFPGGEKIAQEVEKRSNDGVSYFDNPGQALQVYIPGVGELEIEVSDDYKKFWVRSLPGKNFVCIEPVMNNVGGLLDTPLVIQPGDIHKSWMRIKLKKQSA